jgi:unsaturated rhamnogalacturonyl hydrolase
MPPTLDHLLPLALAAFTAPFLAAQVTAPSAEELARINRGSTAPDYPFPYPPAEVSEIESVLARVHAYLEARTPVGLVHRETGDPVRDLSAVDEHTTLAPGHFRLVTYEWGVTYAGMLGVAEATGDPRYRAYVDERLRFISETAPAFAPLLRGDRRDNRNPFRSVLAPHSLDDSGSMAAAMLQAHEAGLGGDLRPLIDRYLAYIRDDQKRLADGTLARDRPLHDAVWLDDLYMSVPALARMGVLTGESAWFDDAARQILQFAERMFVPEKGLFMHAWIQDMEPHPAFFWGRANGWAILALTELLSVLPETHPAHRELIDLYRRHVRGLAATQGIDGRWHQLLDRAETYPETSCTAMFTYCLARGINRGWLDPLAYGPAASAGWNAAAAQVNAQGQVEGTCVGTGMDFEPVFYAHRPTSVFAAHGYGPILLAGAEMILLRQGKGHQALVSDGAVQFAPRPGW